MLVSTASLVKLKETLLPQDTLLPFFRKLQNIQMYYTCGMTWHSFQCDALKWAMCRVILSDHIQKSPQNISSDAFSHSEPLNVKSHLSIQSK